MKEIALNLQSKSKIFVEIISTFPSLDLENFHQKKSTQKRKSVKISLKQKANPFI
jgi:hypothetical protein